jgi:PAS domain S-box-containing protein
MRNVNRAPGEAAKPPKNIASNPAGSAERRRPGEPLDPIPDYPRAMFDHALDAILFVDDEKRFVDANPAACQLLGYRLDELLQMNLRGVSPPEKHAMLDDLWQRLLAEGTLRGEYTVLCQDGTARAVEYQAVARALPDIHLAVLRDVTQRKQAEEKLRRNEALLAEAQQVAHVGSWNWDVANDTVDWSNEHYRIFGLQPQELEMTFDRVLAAIHPDDRATVQDVVGRAFVGHQPFDYCLRALHPDGTVRHVQSRGQMVFDEAGRPTRMFGTVQDITERIQGEEQLRDSEQRFRQLAEHIGEVFWLKDLKQSQVVYVSPAYEKIWGRTRESLYRSPKSWTEVIHPEDRQRVVEADAKTHLQETYDQTYRIVRPDGSIRWIRDRAFPVYDVSGQLIRLAGIAEDITESKTLQDELAWVLNRLRLQIDRLPLAYILIDADGRVADCNPAAEKTFGFTKQEALGRICLDLIVPSPVDDRVREIVRRIWAGDMGAHNVNDNKTKDGRIITCEWFNTPLIESDGLFVGVISLALDITARKRADEVSREHALRSQVLSRRLVEIQEDERRRISRELHDEIGQVLTTIGVNLQALRETREAAALPRLDESINLVKGAIRQVRHLAHELRPAMLDDLGLVVAVRSYLDRQAQLAGFSIQFQVDPIVEKVPPEVETACFRVVQEALTNIVRHARPQQVRVELRRHETDLQLLIDDDGIGFDVVTARGRALRGESLGLLGMEERVALLGGRIEIRSSPAQGTTIHACFPIGARVHDADAES